MLEEKNANLTNNILKSEIILSKADLPSVDISYVLVQQQLRLLVG
jgi:hypothetical protein